MSASEGEATRLVVQHLARFIGKLSTEELMDLASRRARLTLEYPEQRGKGRARRKDLTPADRDEILTRMAGMGDRSEGHEYLASLNLSRASLLSLAKQLEVPVQKSDNVERLRDRIVEGSIGYRLRSQAVRGTTPRAKPGRDPIQLPDGPSQESDYPGRSEG
jgi:hypothetical protein